MYSDGSATHHSIRILLNMPVSLVHFTAFFQGEDKLVERGENRDLWRENVLCGDVTYATCSLSTSNSLHEKLYKKKSQTTYVTFMAQIKRGQKIIIFSHSLAFTLFQPRL